MHPANRPAPFRIRCQRALAALVFVCLALSGCKQVDPLEALRQQQTAGDYAGSIEPLRELLASRPEDPEANYLYGRALAFTQPNLAVWPLRKAMDDPKWFVPAGTQLAFLSMVGEDLSEAIKITGRLLEREPDNVQVLLLQAQARAHSKKDFELALADAKRVLELDPNKTEAYEPLILALLGLNRLKEASDALAEAGGLLDPLGMDASVRAWHCATTAMFQQESGELEKTRATWIACLEAHPTDPDVVSSSVNFYDTQGERERSLEIMRAAIAGAPTSRYFRNALAQRLNASGDTAEAEAVLRETTGSKEPGVAAAAWMDLGKFQESLGEYDAAADALEQSVEQLRVAGSPDPEVLFEYADALVLAERFDAALEVAEDLPVPAHRHLIRGRVAQERREPARALQEFDEVLKLWPDNPWARYYAALAAEELGDFDRALEEFRNAIRINPSATDARTFGAALLLASGNLSSALTVLQTEMADAPLEIEGLLLGMRISGAMGNTVGVAQFLSLVQASHPAWAGQALAEAAEGLAGRNGPRLAVKMLESAPGVDFNDPRYAAALRALVKYSHAAGETHSAQAALKKALAAHPDSSALQEIRGLDLELSGAPAESVSAAYTRALELGPGNAQALTSLGRLAAAHDPEAALGFFDRAAAADPSDPDPKLGAARALIASGKLAEAEQRLDALLIEHPFEAEAAAECARLDLEQKALTPRTLERARRAVRFGGGADALELLSRVHTLRNEPELAARTAEQALALRERKAPGG